ncbi:MAG: membrane lipoprotein lipid attachment site-containing protein [Defluviitaleaceae bacterium]|nr:membrane lipoprotein lipid attachment site-containing protein [Defluviitaleaceae bacterium]
MKKILLVISVVLLFALAGCSQMYGLDADRVIADRYAFFYPIEGDTFSRHLQDIRLLSESERMNTPPSAEALSEQLARLHQFAEKLNAGGTEFSDIRVSRISHFPNRDVSVLVGSWDSGEVKYISFDINFLHDKDLIDEELFAEMLAFTGIDEDNIHVSRGWLQHNHIAFFHGYPDYLLVNSAVYEIAQPYLRLREFAKEINVNTTYYHEVTITSIWDNVQSTSFDIHSGFVFPPSYRPNDPVQISVGLSNHQLTQDETLIAEILQLTGLSREQIRFEVRAIDSNYINYDFLRVNEELAELTRQHERMMEFMDLIPVRSVRRGIIMDGVIGFLVPPNRGAAQFADGIRRDGRRFGMGFSSEEHAENEELMEVLLAFTQIPRNEIEILGGVSRAYRGFQRMRDDLNEEEKRDLLALEAYKETANAPFWQNRDLHDPVIVRIEFPHSGRSRNAIRMADGSPVFNPNSFILYLYDPDLLGLTIEEIAERTSALKEEITAATGVENFQFNVAENPLW